MRQTMRDKEQFSVNKTIIYRIQHFFAINFSAVFPTSYENNLTLF